MENETIVTITIIEKDGGIMEAIIEHSNTGTRKPKVCNILGNILHSFINDKLIDVCKTKSEIYRMREMLDQDQ